MNQNKTEITQLSNHKDCDLIKYMQSVFQSEAWHSVPDSGFFSDSSAAQFTLQRQTITLFSIVM